MEPLTERSAELLTVTIREASDDFCWSAFVVLSKRGREASNAVPVLIAGLDAANPRVAAKAAEVLGEIATANKETLGALEKAMQHEFLMVRDAAEESLRKIEAKNN